MSTCELQTKYTLAEQVLTRFLARHPVHVGDAKVYSHDAWKARKEPYGRGSLATLVMDGSPLYAAANGHTDDAVLGDLTLALDACGMFYELGFAWTLHVFEV